MHLHRPDNLLPGTEILLEPGTMAERIGGWMGPGELSVTNIRYKPGTSCLVSYDLVHGGKTTYLHAKAFTSADWSMRRQKIDESDLLDEEFCFAVFKFPVDANLDALQTFSTNPASFLSRVLNDEFSDRAYQNFDVLAYKPNRRFVAKLNFSTGDPIVLKLHDESTFQSALEAAVAIKKLGVDIAPVRAGRSARHRALAYQWIHGNSMDIAGLDNAQRRRTMEQVFDYLHQLHQPLNAKKIKLRVRQPIVGIREIASDLAVACRPLASLAACVADDILDNQLDEFNPVFVHGDFYDQQLIVQPGQIRAGDFDDCCIDDSSVDLANLVAHLNYRVCIAQLPFEVAADVNEQCLNNIDRTGGRRAIQSFQWNKAACLFRLATHPFRTGSGNWIEQTESVLRRVFEDFQSGHNEPGMRIDTIQRKTKREHAAAEKTHDRLVSAIQDDSKFSFVSPVFDKAIATEVLKEQLPKLSAKFGNFTVNQVLPRRHKTGRRCLIEFELATDCGFRSIFGKASARRLDRNARKTQRSLFRNHQFDSGSEDGISVPETLGCCDRWQMWFQEKVDAVTAGVLMEQRQLNQFSDRIAPAIAKLHRSSFPAKRAHSINDELSILQKRLTMTMDAWLGESNRIEDVLKNCFAIGNEISRQAIVPIHRDFYQDQIMFSADRTYLVDLDLVSLGHPALDIGNFAAHLTEHGIRIHGNENYWSNVETSIIDQYLALNPTCSRFDIEAFKAISFARHIFISWRMPQRRQVTPEIMETADRLIDEIAVPQNKCYS